VFESIGIRWLTLMFFQSGADSSEGQSSPLETSAGDPPPTNSAESSDSLFGKLYQSVIADWSELGPMPQTMVALVVSGTLFFLFRRILLRRIELAAKRTENDLDDRLAHFIRRFYVLGMLFLTALWVMRIWEIEISPLLAGAGIIGISLGFAAKEFIADILAGVFLITDRPMAVGDRIKVERIGSDWGSWGDVIDIGLRRTQIRNTDGVVINYPNAILSNSVITNFSHEESPMRVRVRFSVSLDADLAQAKEVTRRAVEATEGVIPGTAEVVVRSIWDQSRGILLSGALLEARYRVDEIRERTRIRSRVLESIVEECRKEAITLPKAQITMADPS